MLLHSAGVCRIFTARRWASAVLAIAMWLSVSVTSRSSIEKDERIEQFLPRDAILARYIL